MKVKVLCDSSSAMAIAGRIGTGKVRHIQTRYLWIQERVARKEIELENVKGDKNGADLMTKVMPSFRKIEENMNRIGQYFVSGTARTAKKLNTKATEVAE